MKLSVNITDGGITLETGQAVWLAARNLLSQHGLELRHPRLRENLPVGMYGGLYVIDAIAGTRCISVWDKATPGPLPSSAACTP